MSIYTIGEVLKRERLNQGITQEDLAEGFCSVSWLSKIESGSKTPTPQLFEMLMGRMGKKVNPYVVFKTDQDLELSNLKEKVNAFYRSNKINEGREVLKQFEGKCDEKNLLGQQFKTLMQVLLYEDELSPKEQKEGLLKALDLTRPDFKENEIMNYFLSAEEIVIINALCSLYADEKNFSKAINLFKKLLAYLEQPKFDIEEKKKIYPSIVFNLATSIHRVGHKGSYSESVYYAEKGITFCLEYNVLHTLPKLLYTKGFSLAQDGYTEKGKLFLKQSYHFFHAINMRERAEKIKQQAKKYWDLEII